MSDLPCTSTRRGPGRFVADLLSLSNLGCGVLSITSAASGHLGWSLILLLLGAGFDGLDGAAARRWGGTRWGVYSDDVADGVSYGLAPGLALAFTLPGVEGTILGIAFTVFVWSRLVFFTLAKGSSDPRWFRGAPSTLGAIIALCALILWAGSPGLVGLLVGAACMMMVSFDTLHRHVGRYLASHKRSIGWVMVGAAGLLGAAEVFGVKAPTAALLAGALGYGLLPVVVSFRSLFKARRQAAAAPTAPQA